MKSSMFVTQVSRRTISINNDTAIDIRPMERKFKLKYCGRFLCSSFRPPSTPPFPRKWESIFRTSVQKEDGPQLSCIGKKADARSAVSRSEPTQAGVTNEGRGVIGNLKKARRAFSGGPGGEAYRALRRG
jgi:hypothetical protein